MAELFDQLTEEDKELITEYIQSFSEVQVKSLKDTLSYWNKNKKTMYKALGKQLRVKVPIEIKKNKQLFIRQLREIYTPSFPLSIVAINSNSVSKNNHPFIEDFHNFLIENMQTYIFRSKEMEDLFSYINVEKGYLFFKNYEESFSIYNTKTRKTLTIKNGEKTIKAIQKVLKFMRYPNMPLFEKWRNKISDISTSKLIKTNLVFSIHPIDFMTMSDNECDWNSCMNWRSKGSYSTGTIEMMNSNMVIVAYLESSKKWIFNEKEIPNKSWRVLFYVHKKILLEGKPYPYYNEELAKTALTELRKIVKKNLNWDYQYKNQLYKDIKFYYDNHYLRNLGVEHHRQYVKKFDKTTGKYLHKHSIYIYTNGMYNDLVHGFDNIFWCCRNWVPKSLSINASGLATCLHCGKPIETQSEIYDAYDEDDLVCHSDQKYCLDCEDKYWCYSCHTISSKEAKKDFRLLECSTISYYREGGIEKLRFEAFKLERNIISVCEKCATNFVKVLFPDDDRVFIMDKKYDTLDFKSFLKEKYGEDIQFSLLTRKDFQD